MRLFKEGSSYNEETGHYEPHWTKVLDAQKGRTSERRAARRSSARPQWGGLRSRIGGLLPPPTGSKDRSLNGKARIRARKEANRQKV
jgi:hypothetical protein